MTNQHQLTMPNGVMQAWVARASVLGADLETILLEVARWGADQELEACVQLTRDNDGYDAALGLRASRRPKPPSLKEQALGAVGRFNTNAHTRADEMARDFETIRRALEALPND